MPNQDQVDPMPFPSTQDPIDFVRLGGHTVRVTSWKVSPSGEGQLVTISRGTRDAELLDELLAEPRIELGLPGQDPVTVTASEIDRREFGEGQSRITRFDIALRLIAGIAAEPAAASGSLEDRVARLEDEIAALRSALRQFVDRR
jgi:hypothetical protein